MTDPRTARVEVCNEFLRFVASCGRRFFHHDGEISGFSIGPQGHIYLIDKYSGQAVYTAYKGRWRGFTEGGTLRDFISQMAGFIRTGEPSRTSLLGPWPDWYCGGDLWGYGEAMPSVRAKGLELGIFTEPEATVDSRNVSPTKEK